MILGMCFLLLSTLLMKIPQITSAPQPTTVTKYCYSDYSVYV